MRLRRVVRLSVDMVRSILEQVVMGGLGRGTPWGVPRGKPLVCSGIRFLEFLNYSIEKGYS